MLEFEGDQRLGSSLTRRVMSHGTSTRRACTWLRSVAVVWPTFRLRPRFADERTAGSHALDGLTVRVGVL
jgi:hypothetical protein